ncbi:MAG: hypothetical protein ABS68_08180 [Niastella sp. SCN 39-18]|nr:hypothetical protein [Sphingobacteriales bacterium]ODT52550.1 MAG: hypothetical protein ABS68_08180 [Niastella sp. SCN 39-18]OJW11690.1 MAG: hypothetical protein BGO53_12250 [Sphingobacteriales bacterium 39-19]
MPDFIERKILDQNSLISISRIIYDIKRDLFYYINDEERAYLARNANEIPDIDYIIKDTIVNGDNLQIYSDGKDFSIDGSRSYYYTKALVKENESIPKLNVSMIRCIYPGGYAIRLINRMKIESIPKENVDTIVLQRKEWTTIPISIDFLQTYERQNFSNAILRKWDLQKAKDHIMQMQNQ